MKTEIMLLRLTVNNMLLTVAALETNDNARVEDLYSVACIRKHLIEAENEIIKLDKKYHAKNL